MRTGLAPNAGTEERSRSQRPDVAAESGPSPESARLPTFCALGASLASPWYRPRLSKGVRPDSEADGGGVGRRVALKASSPPRGEALRLHVGRLRLEVCALRRTDPPLPEAHWTAPLPLPALPTRFFTLRSPGPAHEASSLSPAPTLGPFLGVGDRTRADPHRVVFPRMDPLLDSRPHRSPQRSRTGP